MIWQRKTSPIFTLAILVAMAVTPKPSVAAFVGKALQPSILATATELATTTEEVATATETSPFALPSAVPSGTTVKINGSGTMTGINQALKQSFEQKYGGTVVTVTESAADAAIQAVAKGEADLAAIGRPLTAEEMALGLVETPISRNKIAIIVSADNPFQGTLTLDQFAKIYTGEITDWSQVDSGAAGAIRAIDHPATSDTRQAFSRYPSFPSGLQVGAETVKLEKDSIQTVVEALGKDGVSYAIASQAINQPGVRALSMYGTMPDDPRYPFSQPLMYVYKGPNPNPAVSAFLGYATAPENQQMVEAAKGGNTAKAEPKKDDGNPLTALLNAVLPADKTESQVEKPVAAAPEAAPAVGNVQPNNIQPSAQPVQPGAATKPDAGTTTALVPSTSDSSAGTATSGLPPWLWWLLPLGLGGLLLGWLMRDRPREEEWETLGGDDRSDDRLDARLEGRSGYDAPNSTRIESNERWSTSGSDFVAGATDRVSETVRGAANTVGDVASNTAEEGRDAIAGGAAMAAGAGAAAVGGLGSLFGRKQQTPDVPDVNLADTPERRGVLGGISNKVGDLVDGAKQKASSIGSNIGDAASGAAAGVADTAGDVARGAGNAVSNVTDAAGNAISGARDAAGNVRDAAGNVVEGAREQAGNFATGARNAAGNVARGAGNVAANVTDTIGDVASGARDAAGNLVGGNVMGDAVEGVGNTANTALSNVADAAGRVGQGGRDVAANLKDVAGQTAQGVGRVKDAAGNWIEDATQIAQDVTDTTNS
jgi:ABC-type phosphate transport system substrate-binding protein